jgi:trans-2,3-dihydro-3-hydroxyanthranilate isomerase
MPAYRFYQTDVFTDRPLAGNALAVFPSGEGLDAPTMQALAREMNLSETTFVFPSQRATRRVRFFTPAAEIPLAGHPTIGTWWVLAELGELDLPEDGAHRVTQETGAGVLPVELYVARGRPTRVVMTQALPVFGDQFTDRQRLAAGLGCNPEALSATIVPQVVSTALPQLMVPLHSLDDLEALPSGGAGGSLTEALRAHGTDCAMCFTTQTRNPGATVHCRMFAPGLGVPEDPATGSAAGALGAYLVHHGVLETHERRATIVVEQGLEIGRPSSIHVDIETGTDGAITAVRVGGQAVTIIEADVRL